jgi:hypothetical protein
LERPDVKHDAAKPGVVPAAGVSDDYDEVVAEGIERKLT